MLLKVEGLCKSYKHVEVLKNVSFELEIGNIMALLGKSGAGKTTIMRCLMGLEKADKGTIIIDDMVLCKEENNTMVYANKKELFEIRKHLGMVFQNYQLFPHMTVLKNVILALTDVYKMSKNEATEKGVDFLERIGLGDKIYNYVHELSGGQKQRVAIARSCVTNPKLLCFDEPTAALDSALVDEITIIMKDLVKKDMGILIISHDEQFVSKVSDETIRIVDGAIINE